MESNKVVVFNINKEEYGFPINQVVSIEKMASVTIIPQMPPYVIGVLKIRDELVPIIDTRTILFNNSFETMDNIKLIVTKAKDITVGFVVDEAKEIIDISSDYIKEVQLVQFKKTSYFTGVANLQNRLVTLIDPAMLFDSLEGKEDIKGHLLSHQ
ncbi:chemotaxis protein CheW [Cytobacillus sp. Hm23]